MMGTGRRWAGVVVGTLGLVLAGAGCGGGDDGAPASTAESPTTTTTTSPPGPTDGGPADTTAPEPDPDDLPEGIERVDYLTFAQGAMPVSFAVDGPGDRPGTHAIVQVIDGLATPRILVEGADDSTTLEMTFALPALTTFDRFAVPRVEEVPSPQTTFFRTVEVEGSVDGPDGGFVALASATLATHADRDEVTELALAASIPVRYVRVRLTGGIDIQRAQSHLEFSELIGNGTQEPVELVDGFTGTWDVRLADVDRSAGLMELKQDGALVVGCFGSADLTGTATGNLVRLRGVNRSDGTASAYVLGLTDDGTVQGVISQNGGPFVFHVSQEPPAGATTRCSDTPEPEHLLGCGSVIHGINFDVNSARLRPESTPILDELFAGLQADAAAAIVVEGHTSTEGSDGYNQDLSERRAQAVVDDLVRRGLDGGRISAQGRGETEPLIRPDDDEAARSMNRRVEITCS